MSGGGGSGVSGGGGGSVGSLGGSVALGLLPPPPDFLSGVGVLVGRIIVPSGAEVFVAVAGGV